MAIDAHTFRDFAQEKKRERRDETMGHAACLPLAHRKPDRADETGGLTVALTSAAKVRLPLRNALGMKRVLRRSVNWSGKRDLNPRPSPWQF